jgi:hypothetical protein
LTTVTDHRHRPLGKARAVHTADNGSDQFHVGFASGHRGAAAVTSDYPTRQKGARRSSGTKRKRPCPRRRAGTCRRETKRQRIADSARPPPGGGYEMPGTRPPKPFVEPLFTCQRTSVRQAAPKMSWSSLRPLQPW